MELKSPMRLTRFNFNFKTSEWDKIKQLWNNTTRCQSMLIAVKAEIINFNSNIYNVITRYWLFVYL